jgi:hypothetical protein
VTETGFLSPVLLVDLLAHTSPLVEAMWAAANLHAPSEGVWWAGIDLAPVWLDIARDFSEDWTHQQQIRDAVGRPGLTEAQFLDPLIDTFLRALPNTYHHVPAGLGESVLITIDDHGRELTWSLLAEPAGWTLHRAQLSAHTARIRLPADVLWRLATGAISASAAVRTAHLEGPRNWPNRSSTSCPLCAKGRLESDAARACLSAGSSFEAAGASRAKAVDLVFLCGRRQARPAWSG